MAEEKLAMLLTQYQNNPKVLAKIQEYMENKLPKLIEAFVQREKRKETLEREMEIYINLFFSDPNTQFYYIPISNIFIHYDGKHYKTISEDTIWHIILSDISSKEILMDWKYKVKTKIIKCIKERNITKSIPESNTIQNVLKFLYPTFFKTKDQAKYFLTCLGDNIFRKNSTIEHFIEHYANPILLHIQDNCYFLFKNTINPTYSFKYNFRESNEYNNCRLLHFNITEETQWRQFIKNNILDILVVSCHYSKRYTSADYFIQHHCHNEEIKSHILYLKDKNINQIIDHFISTCINQETACKVEEETIFYLWKNYLITHSFPFCINKERVKQLLQEKIKYESPYFLNINSLHLSYITPFQFFWKKYMFTNTESDFEISEICSLVKDTFQGISEDKMLSLIKHFYPEYIIQGNKYILNIGCSLWNKEKEIIHFIHQLKNKQIMSQEPLSFYKMYELYCEHSQSQKMKYITSKQYFEKIIQKIIPSEFLSQTAILPIFWES